ncbi:MAG TPA: Fe-S cluster assembly protein SufD, partial [Planctomycetota bacterium]|nr:Fe-S cluster assembly protein SufD [Planctomycetota bacterium]
TFRKDFEALDRVGGPLQALRRGGWERFAAHGIPTTREEGWRFTDLAPLSKQAFAHGRPSKNGIASAKGGIAPGLVFVDGHYRADLSAPPKGVEVASLAEAVRKDPGLAEGLGAAGEGEPFVALNAAFLEDGAFLRVRKGFRLPVPLHLLFVGTSKAAHPRNLYLIEEGAEAVVVETYASAGEAMHLTNAVSDVRVGKGASLAHYRLQLEGASFHLGAVRARIARDGRFVSHNVVTGGVLTRNDITGSLEGENGHCTLNGLMLLRGTQHADNYTRLEHRMPHCESHELYKGVLDDRASGVFTGRIHVYPDAQKTDAYQASANLLLTDTATVDSQPQLEIYADDVKCSHGSTVGQLDPEALFYLRSRGLDEVAARHLLVRAFAGDVADRLDIAAVRQRVDGILAERLGG